ncbi:hypothetical protein NB640_10675 [Oxalobacter vibrioformis]|uniref:Uncharacterized protein n=1 Tax=Oxalobacter vibrioformis TaxID=933080 RepID=A0A9E9LVM2_9BURK|nr:hypothetical protein [Oxalobacter vibrioformis]WAW09679.1 hypothetical protein NB640_10675 [Oxalobacter vibrioformis]
MNTFERKAEANHPLNMDRRQNSKKVDIVEHGIRIQADYGYVRAAQYMFNNGVGWPVIQRVLHSHVLRRRVKGDSSPEPLH